LHSPTSQDGQALSAIGVEKVVLGVKARVSQPEGDLSVLKAKSSSTASGWSVAHRADDHTQSTATPDQAQ